MLAVFHQCEKKNQEKVFLHGVKNSIELLVHRSVSILVGGCTGISSSVWNSVLSLYRDLFLRLHRLVCVCVATDILCFSGVTFFFMCSKQECIED